ncbi:Lrp/AsnC family transcriptional regulator [Levilactobacillus enshiensis]|uniref:Lrp/AsnC family transcriptional regulator n=1 Tax=Levilactobacillus enshiensis TaxID=2590213 RepID=UPI00117A5414|nr:AsnC family transcriptional regulator [Levilactobacillus enshiensis]
MPDETDIAIIKELNRDSRIKTSHLADLVHLSAPAVAARIQRLEDTGVITKYTIEVDLDKIARPRQVFIQVAVQNRQHADYLKLVKRHHNDFRHHYRTTGSYDYMLEGAFHDRHVLNDFLLALGKVARYQVIDVIDDI